MPAIPEIKPWFYFTYSNNVSYEELAKWANIAAVSIPPIDLTKQHEHTTLLDYNKEDLRYSVAFAIMDFFNNGYWIEYHDDVFCANLSFRLRVVSAFLHEVAKTASVLIPIFNGCSTIASLAGECDRNGVLRWFTEKYTEKVVSGSAVCDVAALSSVLRFNDFKHTVESRYDRETFIKRRAQKRVDSCCYPHPLALIGYLYDILDNLSQKRIKTMEDALSEIIIKAMRESNT